MDFLQNEYIPKNAIFSNTYKDMDYVLSKNLKTTSIPDTVFKEVLFNAIINYCTQLIKEQYKLHSDKSDSILDQIFNESILFPLYIYF